jgi:glycerophosphoryl diester phosphodiesterase
LIRSRTVARCRARSRPQAARSGRRCTKNIDSASIKEAHQLGLKVVVWTVNKAEDMARLMDMGVDGIISDNPDVLRAVAAKKGIALPAPAPVSP